MRVPDQADTLPLDVQALARLRDREDVLPDRVARAGVVQADARVSGPAGRGRRGTRACRRGSSSPSSAPRRRRSSRSSGCRCPRVTTRSWLPARHTSTTSETSSVQSSGWAPYPTMSPRHQTWSGSWLPTSASTACSAGRLLWMSEMTATRMGVSRQESASHGRGWNAATGRCSLPSLRAYGQRGPPSSVNRSSTVFVTPPW